MPERLLPLLTLEPQSGDDLGRALGVGRVTVNTLARKLVEDGVPVVISRGGYALLPGTPAPQLVNVTGQFGRALRYTGTLGSTQDEIRRWADDAADPAPHGAVWVAERQTRGRGRRGRPWDTVPGALAFSVLLRGDAAGTLQTPAPPRLTLPQLALLPLGAGVALHQALGGVGGLKWPNDLLAPDGRKLAGILLDADLRGEEVRRAVLGIGVNVTSAPPGASCVQEWQPGATRAQVLSDVLAALEHWLYAPAQDILTAWRERNVTLGQRVQASTPEGPRHFTALDLDAQGGLIVQDDAGAVQTIQAGDVHLVGRWGEPAP